MRVGLFTGTEVAEAGGAYTFVSAVIGGVEKCGEPSGIDIMIIGSGTQDERETIPLVPIPRGSRRVFDAFVALLRQLREVVVRSRLRVDRHELRMAWLNRLIRENDIDFAWGIVPLPGPLCVPYATTCWDLQQFANPYFPELLAGGQLEKSRTLVRTTLSRAALVFVGTEVGRSEVVNFCQVSPQRVVVVPLPAPEPVEPKPPRDAMPKTILYPAQFWPHKNHVTLLRALRIMLDQGVECRLLLTGSDKGNLERVRSEVSRLRLEQHVNILGFVPSDELDGLYRDATLVVYPSLFGPDNLPPLESMARGCPVACSGLEGMVEQLGDAATYFNPTSPEEIAERCSELIADAVLRDHLIRRGRLLVRSLQADSYAHKALMHIEAMRPVLSNWGES